MILEVAPLSLKIGTEPQFEATFKIAAKIIFSMPGYITHDLRRCLERRNELSASNRFLLIPSCVLLKLNEYLKAKRGYLVCAIFCNFGLRRLALINVSIQPDSCAFRYP
jgi:hypothetical protein